MTDQPRTDHPRTDQPETDHDIHRRITELVTHEHELRAALAAGTLSSADERSRLQAAEEALDRCWDLLRQRQARREAGDDPDQAQARPVGEVEGYRQ